MEKSLLIATNGSRLSLPAVNYGVWLAGLLHLPVTLLGIVERQAFAQVIQQAFQPAKDKLAEQQLEFTEIIEQGEPGEIICKLADAQKHLVVLGPMTRPGWQRILSGVSFRQVLTDIQTPMIFAAAPKEQLKKILLCLGGLGYTKSLQRWVNYLAKNTGASLNILHIVVPGNFNYPITTQIKAHWEEMVKTDTPQGRNLRLALQTALEAGIETKVKIRHGDVIHEIKAEVREQGYDLVAMGSASSSQSLRRLYLPNVTAEIAERSAIPVLTARLGQELIFPALESK